MPELSPTVLESLNNAITNRSLESVGNAIRTNAAPCLSIVAAGTDDYTTIGKTRFGGDPDLPKDAEWPADPEDGRFSNFIAQINFAEMPAVDGDDVLPKNGILYTFVRYMESAAEPVTLDSVFFDGDPSLLNRRLSPPKDSLCDEYLVDLCPQRVSVVPSVSIASFRKQFRDHIEQNTDEADGDDGVMRRLYMQSDLCPDGQIGQLLGFANAGDESEDLYRQLVLARLGKRELIYNDYWNTLADYDDFISGFVMKTHSSFDDYVNMRDGVIWLTSNRELIQSLVDEWRLLFRLDSNFEMDLNINDADPMYVFIRNEDLANRDFSNLACEVTQG